MAPFMKKRVYEAKEYFPWIDKLRDNGAWFHTIGISGGEPFLHPDIDRFVREIKDRYNCFINLFTNCFWLKDEAAIDKHADALSRSEILMVSPYKPIVDKIGGMERFLGLTTQIRDRFGIKVGIFHGGVVDNFLQFEFLDDPRDVGPDLKCDMKECHQLTATGLLHRCPMGFAVKDHPAVTEGLRASQDMSYDLGGDLTGLGEWKARWPMDACRYCTASLDAERPTEWVSDVSIRKMDGEQYKKRLSELKEVPSTFEPYGTMI
jgi:hypothetical protein